MKVDSFSDKRETQSKKLVKLTKIIISLLEPNTTNANLCVILSAQVFAYFDKHNTKDFIVLFQYLIKLYKYYRIIHLQPICIRFFM